MTDAPVLTPEQEQARAERRARKWSFRMRTFGVDKPDYFACVEDPEKKRRLETIAGDNEEFKQKMALIAHLADYEPDRLEQVDFTNLDKYIETAFGTGTGAKQAYQHLHDLFTAEFRGELKRNADGSYTPHDLRTRAESKAANAYDKFTMSAGRWLYGATGLLFRLLADDVDNPVDPFQTARRAITPNVLRDWARGIAQGQEEIAREFGRGVAYVNNTDQVPGGESIWQGFQDAEGKFAFGKGMENLGWNAAFELPYLAAQIGLTVWNPVAGMAFMGLRSAGGEYSERMDDPNFNTSSAGLTALEVGAVDALLSYFIDTKIIKGAGDVAKVKAGFGRWLKTTGIGAVKEGGEEVEEQIAGNFARWCNSNEKGTWGNFLAALWDGVPDSFVMGTILGVPMAGVGATNDWRLASAMKLQEQRIRDYARLTEYRNQLLAKSELTPLEMDDLRRIEAIREAGDMDKVRDILFTEALLAQRNRGDAKDDMELAPAQVTQNAEIRIPGLREVVHNPDDSRAELDAVRKEMNIPAARLVAYGHDGELPTEVRERAQRDSGDGEIPAFGFYDEKSDTAYINVNKTSPHMIRQLLWHEYLTHRGLRKFLGDAGMNALLDDVWKEYGEFIWKSDIPRKYGADLESAAGQRLAAEEFLARHAEEMSLRLTWAWDNEESSRFRKFLSGVRKRLSPVLPKSYLAYTSDARMARMLAYALRPLYYDAADYAGQGAAGGGTRFAYNLENAVPSKKRYKVERVNENAGRMLNNSTGVICEKINQVFDPAEAPHVGFKGWIAKKIRDFEHDHPLKGPYDTPALGGVVKITGSSIRSIGNHDGPDAKYNLLPVVPELLKNAVLVQTEVFENQSKDISRSHLLAAKVRYGENERYVAVMVIHESNGKFYYDHSLLVLKEGELGRKKEADNENRNPAKTAGSLSHSAQVLNVVRNALLSSGFDTKSEKNTRFAVSPIYTGSAADYEAPSLHYVGTGEGAQAYGWGLYGSSEKQVGEYYARQDAVMKQSADILYDGTNSDVFFRHMRWRLRKEGIKDPYQSLEYRALSAIHNILIEKNGNIENVLRVLKNNPEDYPADYIKILEAYRDRIRYRSALDGEEGNRHLYEQTFWPDKQENLLDWDTLISREQLDQIHAQLKKEGLFDTFQPAIGYGEELYKNLVNALGSPKAASEFLYRAGIDGITYIGDDSGVRNYVAFSDKDIRVNRHVRYAIAEDEDAETGKFVEPKEFIRSDLLQRLPEEKFKVLRDLLVETADRSRMEVYDKAQQILADHGFDVDRGVARALAAAALDYVKEREKTIRRRNDNDYISSVDEYIHILSGHFGEGFKLNFNPEFTGEEKSGTWVETRKRTKEGVQADEAAAVLSREWDRDVTTGELFEHFNGLTRRMILGKHSEETRAYIEAMKAADYENDMMLWEEIKQGKLQLTPQILENHPNIARFLRKTIAKSAFMTEEELAREFYKQINTAEVPNMGDPGFVRELLTEAEGDLQALKDKIRSDKADALELQRRAADFARKHLPPEARGEFQTGIVNLLDLSAAPTPANPQGARMRAFEKLLDKMQTRAETIRRGNLREALDKRLAEVHSQVNASRRMVGTRDLATQALLDEIVETSRLPRTEIDRRVEEQRQKLEQALNAGEDPAAIEEEIVKLTTFGDLDGKTADELKSALDMLNAIAREGRAKLAQEIEARRARDRETIDWIIRRVTDGKGLKIDQAEFDAHWKSLEKAWGAGRDFIFGLLKLEDLLYLMAANRQTGDWIESPVGKLFQHVHESNVAKDTAMRHYTEYRDKMLREAFKVNSGTAVALKLAKFRERVEHTGIFRNSSALRVLSYEELTVAEARAKLAEYDAGKPVLQDYQAEFLRDRLDSLDLRMDRSYKRPAEDGVTETILAQMDALDAKSEYKTVSFPVVKFTDGKGYEMQNLNQMEALYLHLMWQQRDVRYKMRFNGYTDETMQAVEKFLKPEVLALEKPMRELLDTIGVKLDALNRVLYHAPLQRVDHYFPSLFKVEKSGGNVARLNPDDPNAGRVPTQFLPGALKARNAHVKDLRIVDALQVFEGHVLQTAHYIAWAETAREARAVLFNADVKKALGQVFGPEFVRHLNSSVTDTLNGGNLAAAEAGKLIKGVNALYGNAVSMKMLFSVMSGIKQTMSAISYLNDVPLVDFIAGVRTALAHPVETFYILNSSPYLMNRFRGGPDMWSVRLLDQSNRKLSLPGVIGGGLIDVGGWFTRLGDITPVVLAGASVYYYHYNRKIKEGFSPAEAKKYALLRWEMSTESLQQSRAVHNQNAIQRGNAKFLTAFKSSQILNAQRPLRELIAMRFFGGAAARSRRAAASLINMVAVAALIQTVNQVGRLARGKDRDKDLDEMITDIMLNAAADPLAIFPVLGNLPPALISLVAGKPLVSGRDPLFFNEDAVKALRGADRVWDDLKYGDFDEQSFDAAVEMLRGFGLLSPTVGAGSSLLYRAKRLYDVYDNMIND